MSSGISGFRKLRKLRTVVCPPPSPRPRPGICIHTLRTRFSVLIFYSFLPGFFSVLKTWASLSAKLHLIELGKTVQRKELWRENDFRSIWVRFSLAAKKETERKHNLGVQGRLAQLARVGGRKIDPRTGFCPHPHLRSGIAQRWHFCLLVHGRHW